MRAWTVGVLMLWIGGAWAQDGRLDARFGVGGLVVDAIPYGNDDGRHDVVDAVMTPVGGVLVLIAAHYNEGDFDLLVMRRRASGVLDTGFGNGGIVAIPFDLAPPFNDNASAIALMPDGRIVVSGWASAIGGGTHFIAARLLASGSPDPSFGAGGKAVVPFEVIPNGIALAGGMALYPDGRILLSGAVQTGANALAGALVRLNADGSRDTSFDLDGRVLLQVDPSADALDVLAQPRLMADGRIVVVGSTGSSDPNGPADFLLARFHADGSLDDSFNGTGLRTVSFNLGGINRDGGSGLALRPDGRIVAGGGAYTVTSSGDLAVAQLDAGGGLDAGFGPGGRVVVPFDLGGSLDDYGGRVELDAQGRILLLGSAEASAQFVRDFVLARLLSNGALDPAFGNGGRVVVPFDIFGPVPDDRAARLLFTPDGGLLMVGTVRIGALGRNGVGLAKLIGDTVFANGFQVQ